MSKVLNKQWHLAETPEEILVSEFELYLWRVNYGFLRWQEDCENCINSHHLTGHDLAVLHIIRMKDRPKTIYDIGRLMNREDYHNIKYSIRKLEKIKYIKKAKTSQKTIAYQVTEAGVKDTNNYSSIRREVLMKQFSKNSIDLEKAIEVLKNMEAIYDEAGRMVSLYRANDE